MKSRIRNTGIQLEPVKNSSLDEIINGRDNPRFIVSKTPRVGILCVHQRDLIKGEKRTRSKTIDRATVARRQIYFRSWSVISKVEITRRVAYFGEW